MILENIKKEAARKKMTIYKLEKEAGLANGTVARWNKHYPRVDKLFFVSAVLGVTLNDLFYGRRET